MRCFLALALVASCFAQQGETPVFRAGTRLMQIEVRVTDKGGKPVPDLTAADFELREDGTPQEIVAVDYVPERVTEARSSSESARTAQPQRAGEASPDPVWIYVATEVGPHDFLRVGSAIERFVVEDLRPGVQVSLGGLPFSKSRSRLLATLQAMRRGPYGQKDRSGLADSTLVQVEELEFLREQMRIEERQAAEQGRELPPTVTVEIIDRQIALYGQLALFRYLELVERMALLPGKKIIVLFRAGMRLDRDNNRLMDYLVREAQRRRVTFYTADSRGLEAVVPADQKFATSAWSYRRTRPEVDVGGKLERRQESEQGLRALANGTGGDALLGANDLSGVFRQAVASTERFYVISYTPTNESAEGRFRKISVRVDAPQASVAAPAGYHEPQPFESLSKLDRSIELQAALRGEIAPDLPVKASCDFFAADDRTPLLVLSCGVAPDELDSRRNGRNEQFDLRVVVRIGPTEGEALTTWSNREIRHRVKRSSLANRAGDRTFLLPYNDVFPLRPGPHELRVLIRDEISGRVGVFEETVHAPSFQSPSSPSTLLLSRTVTPYEGESDQDDPLASLLRLREAVFAPDPAAVYHAGERLHFLLHLYNPTAGDLADPNGLGVVLLRDGRQVPGVQAGGESNHSEEDGTLRYAVFVETAGLEPGNYEVAAIPPQFAGDESALIRQQVTVLPERTK